MFFRALLIALIALCGLNPRLLNAATGTSLAIIAAGVQQQEDGAFVTTDYSFFPGDFVYFTFQIAGYGSTSNDDTGTRSINLAYEVTPEDGGGNPLAKPEKGSIQTTLGPQDKNWTPKRRASFLMPSFLAAGTFHVHVAVKDLIAHAQTEANFPFHIGGVKIAKSATIAVQNFAFLRKPNDRQALQVPAYSPGDTVFARFDISGFRYGPGNEYHVAYGLTVARPDGQTFLKQPTAAEVQDKSFYPAQFVPGSINITTPVKSLKGAYVLTLTVRDVLANQTTEVKQAFSIE